MSGDVLITHGDALNYSPGTMRHKPGYLANFFMEFLSFFIWKPVIDDFVLNANEFYKPVIDFDIRNELVIAGIKFFDGKYQATSKFPLNIMEHSFGDIERWGSYEAQMVNFVFIEAYTGNVLRAFSTIIDSDKVGLILEAFEKQKTVNPAIYRENLRGYREDDFRKGMVMNYFPKIYPKKD